MQCLKDEWAPLDPIPGKNPMEHVDHLKCLTWACETATVHLLAAQAKQKQYYDLTVARVGERCTLSQISDVGMGKPLFG